MINVHTFFSDTINTVDMVIGDFVSIAYHNFIQANAGLITALFTLYVMLIGYKFLTHQQSANLSDIMRHLIIMLIVYGMVMQWDLYNLFVYNIFTNEPANIAQVLVNSSGKFAIGSHIAQALDGIYEAIVNTAMEFLGQINFSSTGIAFLFYAILVFLIGNILCVFALLLFIYAKMMMAIALALGPIFILFLLWDSTKSMFTAWLNKLITLALIPVITSAILVLMLSVINVTLPKISQPAANLQFYGIAPFLGLSLTTTLILAQVFRISSSLGGGITLASLSQGLDIARTSLEKSGIAPMKRQLVYWSNRKMATVKSNFFRSKA